MSARPAVLAVAAAALALSARAAGDPVPAAVRLAWVRGEGADACPDGAWLRAEVIRRLRRDPFADDGPRSLEAVVERTAAGWRATLRVRDRDGALLGERALTRDAAACDAIADASALAVALAVDPDAVVDEPSPPAPAVPPPPPPRAPRAPGASGGATLALGALGGVSAGITPSAAPTFGLVGAVELSPRWSARLRLDAATAQPSADGVAAIGFTRATATACVAPWRSRSVAVGVCAGVAGAVVHAAVRGARALDAGDRPWLGATATAGVRWSPAAWWYVGVEAEAAVALARTSFRWGPDEREIATQGLASGGGSVSLGLRSP